MNVCARDAQIRELAVRKALKLRFGPAETLPACVTSLYEIKHGHSPWIDLTTVALTKQNLGAMQQNEYCKFCMTAITQDKSIVYNSFIMVTFVAAVP
jgi:hypothetical protein